MRGSGEHSPGLELRGGDETSWWSHVRLALGSWRPEGNLNPLPARGSWEKERWCSGAWRDVGCGGWYDSVM